MDESSGDKSLQPGKSIGIYSEMDEQSIHEDQETLERSCKRAFDFDSRNVENDSPVVEAVNILFYKIQGADSFPCFRTFSEDQNSSKKLGSSLVPSKKLHVYYRRFEKNQRHNKCKKFQFFFQERHNKPLQAYD